MKIKILKDFNDSKETGRTSTEGMELTSVNGVFTLETTDEEIGEDLYSYNSSKTVFSEDLVLENPELFAVMSEEVLNEAPPKEEMEEYNNSSKETSRSISEIKEKIESIKEDIKLLEDIMQDEETPEVLASKYILALRSMTDILEWVINPEKQV